MRSLLSFLAVFFALECFGKPFDYDPQDAMFIEASIQVERKSRKLPTMRVDQGLSCAAQIHVMDIGNREVCSHKGKYGISFLYRAKKCGTMLSVGSEVVGCKSQFSIETLRRYQKVLYSTGYNKFGCDAYRDYWVCVFGR